MTTAADRVMTLTESCKARLARIAAAADSHFGADPDNCHWGDVGTIAGYDELLRELEQRIFREGEYAA
jgi:hypothetical protein